MITTKVRQGRLLTGTLTVPGDKSISHRSMMLAGLARGTSRITGFLPSEDCLATLEAMRALGVSIVPDEKSDAGFGPTTYQVEGTDRHLRAPAGALDCGNSGTTMRLMSGLLAAQPFASELTGDPSLSRRPMNRIVAPLTEMQARVLTLGEGGCPPLRILGGPLIPIRYTLPVASAQVKSAVLLAGLFAPGITTVIQPVPTRDHTERMLQQFGVELQIDHQDISLAGGQTLQGADFHVPGDISSAAFWLVAAAAQPNASLTIRQVGLNPTRTGILDVLARMGAVIERPQISADTQGEPLGDLHIQGQGLHGTVIEGQEIPNIIDELPILAVAAALAQGETVIRDAQELKVKETDRIHAVVTNLRAMGADVDEAPDGMVVRGGRPLHGAHVRSFGDHRIAMAFAIAGLFAEGQTEIDDTACIRTSYPGFEATLRHFMEDTPSAS